MSRDELPSSETAFQRTHFPTNLCHWEAVNTVATSVRGRPEENYSTYHNFQ